VNLAVPVGPGAYVTLGFNVTAPTTEGVYNFQWRMVNNSTRFGAFTTNFPVDVVQGQAQTLYFVHTDHLNTPRLVADATGTTVWRWDQQEPFGNNVPDENPSGLGVFDLPLRLPGQYFDKETNLHYNYFRDYDPSIGRYGKSDPIGLRAGLNTYAYVRSSPVAMVDVNGLVTCRWVGPIWVCQSDRPAPPPSNIPNELNQPASNDSTYNKIECEEQKCQRYEIRIVIAYTGSDGNSVKLTRCWYYCPESRTYRYIDTNQLAVFFRCTPERAEASGWSGQGHPALMD
jgi:RHS repeat-associated protein